MRQKTDCTKGQSKEAKKEQQTVKQEAESLFEQLACRLIKSEQDKMMAGYLKRGIEGFGLSDLFMSITYRQNNKANPMACLVLKVCQWSAEVFDFAGIEISGFYRNPCRVGINI